MAIRFSTKAWADKELKFSSDKLVFLCLCDHANDKGESWPSVDTIRQRALLSDRGVQLSLKRLEISGKISIQRGGGKHHTNKYLVYPNPEVTSPPKSLHPEVSAEIPRSEFTPNPEVSRRVTSPEPSGTVSEPSKNPNREALEIYEAYPRKVARPVALKAIGVALRKKSFGELLDATREFANMCSGKDVKFIPHPSTWFGQERYNDSLDAQIPKTNGHTNGHQLKPWEIEEKISDLKARFKTAGEEEREQLRNEKTRLEALRSGC